MLLNIPEMQTAHISESTPNGYVDALFAFAQSSYAETGKGLVVIREGNLRREADGRIQAHVQYAPIATHIAGIPAEALDQLDRYSPDQELVLAIISNGGQATVVTMNA
jgi:hypothetical protein